MKTPEQKIESKTSLIEIFKDKGKDLEIFSKRLTEKAEQILTLVPNELEGYKEGALDDFPKWLEDIYNNGPKPDKIKNPGDYGFKDMDDAFQKLQLLKQAWIGVIDVQIDYGEDDPYVFVTFKLPED